MTEETLTNSVVLDTKLLTEGINIVSKCNSNLSSVLITTQLLISYIKDERKLIFRKTDGVNFITYTKDNVDFEEDFGFLVDSEIFTKVINKLTSETITLQKESDKVLKIISNGIYKIPAFSDMIHKYPRYSIDENNQLYELDGSLISELNADIKGFTSKDPNCPLMYSNIFIGPGEGAALCPNKMCHKLFNLGHDDFPDVLIPIEIWTYMTNALKDIPIFCTLTDSTVTFNIGAIEIHGPRPTPENVEKYPISFVVQFRQKDYHKLTVSRTLLKNALEISSILLGNLTNRIEVGFCDNYLVIRSKDNSSFEKINALEMSHEHEGDVIYEMNVNNFKNTLGNVQDELIEIGYEPQDKKFLYMKGKSSEAVYVLSIMKKGEKE